MIVKEKSQKMIGVRMDTIELYMLKSIQNKMKAGNTSSAIRQLIRAAYASTAEQPKTKLSKVEKFVPGETNYMKFDTMECVGVKGAAAIKLVNRIKRKNAIKNKTKLSSLNGQYKLSDGSIVTINN